MDSTVTKSDRPMAAVLPLRGLWRAGLLAAWDFQALDKAGIKELRDLTRLSCMELLELPGLDRAAVGRLQALLARYGLSLAPTRRRRFRLPGLRLRS